MQKDVVLIYPSYSPGNKPKYGLPPLGVLSLGSYLQSNGENVVVIDAEIEGYTIEETVSKALSYSPKVIGISSMTPVFVTALKIAEKIKNESPNLPVCMGGPHLTATHDEAILISDAVDYIVLAEGEETFHELTQFILTRSPDVETISGLIRRVGPKQAVANSPRAQIQDLDALPFPDFDLIDNYRVSNYDHPFLDRRPVTSLVASRGCPYPCLFCDAQVTFGAKLRLRSPETVVDEMAYYKEKYGIQYISIKDSTFNINRKWVYKFCEELKQRDLDLHWRCNVRADLIEEDLFRKMKEVGCRNVVAGVESGSQKILDILKKRQTLKQVEDGFKILKKLEIESLANFIIGNPEETQDDIAQTVRFAIKLDATYAHFSKGTAYPGDGFYEWGNRTGRLADPKWYLKDNIQLKESFLVDPNTGGSFVYDFDLIWEIKKAYLKYFLTPKFALVAFKKVIKDFKFLKTLILVAPKMLSWVGGFQKR